MKQNYTFGEVLASYPKEKRKADGMLTRLIYRPASFPLAWLALNMHLSANAVTYLSIIFCIAGFICSFFSATAVQICGICCFFVFAILDCADGNMARTLKNKNEQRSNAHFGSCVDAIGGYCAYTAILFSMGNSSQLFPAPLYLTPLYVAVLSSSANLLMRVIMQAYRNAAQVDMKTAAGKSKRLSEEIGITGWMPVLYLLGYLFEFLPYIIYLYGIVYCGGCFVSVLKVIRRIEKTAG